jgi:signal transduction histidine kinase
MAVLIDKLSRWIHWPHADAPYHAASPHHPSVYFRFAAALAIVGIATGIRWSFDAALGDAQAYTFYFAAIAITSWYAGFWPSIAAILLSYLAAHWFFIQPRYKLNFHEYSLDDYVSLGGFLFSGLAISFTSRALHAARQRAELKRQQLAREILERERAQQELQEAQALLQEHATTLERKVEARTSNLVQTIQSLEGVCYHLVHDLRAPLRAIQGCTTLLLEDYASQLDQTGKDYARRAADSANRMDALIFSLLEYGQLGHIQFPLASVNLDQLVTDAIARHPDQIRSRDAQIRVDRPLPKVMGNSELLEQVLDNLIGNALKFVAPEVTPAIHIRAQVFGDTARLWIKDNGIGIQPQYQEKIFQIFEQLNGGKRYPGTGIGLALVARAMQKMRGRVGVESEIGKGSQFWIELPLPAAQQQSGLTTSRA